MKSAAATYRAITALVLGIWLLSSALSPRTAEARTSRLKRAWFAVKRSVRRPLNFARAHMTRWADKLEARTPERFKGFVRKLRTATSPMALGKFTHQKFKADGKFLATYGVASSALGYLSLPVLLSTMSPAAVLGVRVAHNLVDAGVLLWRQHHLRTDRSQTLGDTWRQLGVELEGYAEKQRALNRRYLRLLEYKRAVKAEQRAARRQSAYGQGVQSPTFGLFPNAFTQTGPLRPAQSALP
ncbi:MAG: hypothetical protein KC503_43145 [Myxococcales bacterium]|nr:hypothetical protein [Myxococcales bacterium]